MVLVGGKSGVIPCSERRCLVSASDRVNVLPQSVTRISFCDYSQLLGRDIDASRRGSAGRTWLLARVWAFPSMSSAMRNERMPRRLFLAFAGAQLP